MKRPKLYRWISDTGTAALPLYARFDCAHKAPRLRERRQTPDAPRIQLVAVPAPRSVAGVTERTMWGAAQLVEEGAAPAAAQADTEINPNGVCRQLGVRVRHGSA